MNITVGWSCHAAQPCSYAWSVVCGCRKGHLIALDIIRGLVFLHSNKVVHADLKAKNVLLTQNAGKSAQQINIHPVCPVQLI